MGKSKRDDRAAEGEAAHLEAKLTTGRQAAELSERLRRLAQDDEPGWRIGARVRNYFLTGLIIVGPLSITIYIVWSFVNIADTWIKPLLPASYLPETYLPFAVPGIGLIFGIAGLTIIGALAANLLGRTIISFGELMFEGMPVVRNLYRALKHVFEGVVTASGPNQSFQKVGLIQFPSKGLWSLVFVTSEQVGEIGAVQPDGQRDMIAVFMPTGVVPPTGFICFVPRRDVTMLDMSVEDAAKIIISAGMVIPPQNGDAGIGAPLNMQGIQLPVSELPDGVAGTGGQLRPENAPVKTGAEA